MIHLRQFERTASALGYEPFSRITGSVIKVRRDSVRISLPGVRVGTLCDVHTSEGRACVEVVSLDAEGSVAMALDTLTGIRIGDRVVIRESDARIEVGDHLLGRVIDSTGVPYDSGAVVRGTERSEIYGLANNPLERAVISTPIDLGVRAINACLTCGLGQRQGVFAGSGVGKSVLLGMMARYTAADVVVVGLLGERGREVREFLERDLGDALAKSVVVVETADRSAVRRARCAYVATTVAEYFRKQGKSVLLMMDSLTRFAMAQREIGLAAGEPPTSKGYPPSVFSMLSQLVERAGNWGTRGSITGLYTVLVEGDDLEDPIADAARAILDGHIVLSRAIANRGQYPAIDLLNSVSRCMDQVVSGDQKQLARRMKQMLSRYFENEDAINYGLYRRGMDASIDECIDALPKIRAFLSQDREEPSSFAESRRGLDEVFG